MSKSKLLTAKWFDELSTEELYAILRARAQVFIVEQGIRCQDMDGVDKECLHCFFMQDGEVSAYLRAFYEDGTGKTVRIGRVLTVEHGIGLGRELMEESMAVIREKMPCERLCMDAQKQAAGFYEKLGFQITSEEFLEENIVHVRMEREI